MQTTRLLSTSKDTHSTAFAAPKQNKLIGSSATHGMPKRHFQPPLKPPGSLVAHGGLMRNANSLTVRHLPLKQPVAALASGGFIQVIAGVGSSTGLCNAATKLCSLQTTMSGS